MSKTPLEIAMERKKKTCISCESRTEIDGVSYCKVDGKILHPMILEPPYTHCPIKDGEHDEDSMR